MVGDRPKPMLFTVDSCLCATQARQGWAPMGIRTKVVGDGVGLWRVLDCDRRQGALIAWDTLHFSCLLSNVEGYIYGVQTRWSVNLVGLVGFIWFATAFCRWQLLILACRNDLG